MRLLGVDTGGTFTDFIYQEKDDFRTYKVLSTPDDPSRAVIQGMGQLGASTGLNPDCLVHGSTVATNAILERKGVRTGLITNLGFEDVIEIGRQQRFDLYDLAYQRPAHLVPRQLRFGVAGRMGPDGSETEPLDLNAARAAALALKKAGVESVAVCFLFSFANPAHERAMRDVLATVLPGTAVSCSHEILAEFREFERTSTTVVNASVAPIMDRYIDRLQQGLGPDTRLRIMQSNGGSISADTARRESVRTILSGPAGGVVGALAIGREAGFERLMTFDMGGTSTDVCLLDNGLPLTLSASISGYPIRTPMLDIHTVGAGGGSLARLDAGGALAVGPESAGADPGPACYGRGRALTVTDANLALGRLIPDRFLGGTMPLFPERVAPLLEELAARTGLTPLEAAEGVIRVADANMERALRVISVERGHDPAGFTLLSFGGSGGMHCASLARLLGMPRVLVPRHPGILSALGMLLADVIKDYSQTIMRPADELDGPELDRLFRPLRERAGADLAGEGFSGDVIFELALDMRYAGQSFELITPLPETIAKGGLAGAFEAVHKERYGHTNPGRTVEAVNLRLRARGLARKPGVTRQDARASAMDGAARAGTVQSVFNGKTARAPVIERDRLAPGNRFEGPAVVVEYSSTLVVPPDAECAVDGLGNLVLTLI